MRIMFLLMSLSVFACGDKAPEASSPAAEKTATDEAAEGAEYLCPMRCKLEGHDEPYSQAEPGKCPVCGMDLELKKAE